MSVYFFFIALRDFGGKRFIRNVFIIVIIGVVSMYDSRREHTFFFLALENLKNRTPPPPLERLGGGGSGSSPKKGKINVFLHVFFPGGGGPGPRGPLDPPLVFMYDSGLKAIVLGVVSIYDNRMKVTV